MCLTETPSEWRKEMTAWYEDARFDVFADCDVFKEDGHYLYVENQAYDYNGSYVCCDYQQGRNLDGTMFYMRGDVSGASNDYVMGLEKAPWDIARDIIGRVLDNMKEHETAEFKDVIDNAKHYLMEYATEDEKFSY
mgnify:CR=1 FL=1